MAARLETKSPAAEDEKNRRIVGKLRSGSKAGQAAKYSLPQGLV
jgi:hypothetical protein